MARRRLTPAQPSYLVPGTASSATETPLPSSPQEMPPIARVAGDAAGTVAARQLAEELRAAKDEGRMVIEVPLADIAPGYLLRDRIALDREDLDSLKQSIREHGQRVPAEITPLTGTRPGAGATTGATTGAEPVEQVAEGASAPVPYGWGLISGWRRLRALSELLSETQDPRFSTLRALVRRPEEAVDSYVAMVEENEVRAGLSYYERARLVSETTARGVFADRGVALRTLFGAASRAKRSKIGSFVDLHEALGDLLKFPSEIPERLGLMLVAALRDGRQDSIRQALQDRHPDTAEAEIALLTRLAKPPQASVSRTKRAGEVLRPGVEMTTIRKGTALTLTLSGEGVDEALLEKLRRALR